MMIDFESLKFHSGGGVEVRQDLIPKGQFVVKHKHDYDHLSILAGGAVVVDVEGEKTEYRGHAVIEIKANKWHEITALEDSHWFCIHATSLVESHE